MIDIVSELGERGIELISLQDHVDTGTATGKLTFAIFGALPEFEGDIIRGRTNAGLQAARSGGNNGGRKPSLNKQDIAIIRSLTPILPYPLIRFADVL